MALRRKAIAAACLLAAAVVGLGWAALSPDDWEPTLTADPALIAQGRALFDNLPPVGDSRRDPYATACGSPGADYCSTSPTLTRAELVAATGAQLVAQGARLERRDCPERDPDDLFPDWCVEVYSYRGVQVQIAAGEEAGPFSTRVPTYLHGQVLSSVAPKETSPVALGSWEALDLAPAAWGEAPCVNETNSGCFYYKGRVRGAGTAEDARRTVRAKLQQAGFRVETDQCKTAPDGGARCQVVGSRFRSLNGRDEVLAIAVLSAASPTADAFTGLISVNAESFKPAPVSASL